MKPGRTLDMKLNLKNEFRLLIFIDKKHDQRERERENEKLHVSNFLQGTHLQQWHSART